MDYIHAQGPVLKYMLIVFKLAASFLLLAALTEQVKKEPLFPMFNWAEILNNGPRRRLLSKNWTREYIQRIERENAAMIIC